ncbi:glutaredoxin family protein [Pseudalkalibacillus decolorationis]|uniref:glutaredoxin family protein n=1 Tax=Pseudalkalibacillus decolorationis TaxID=163879 RepID=UPI00214752FE|nr:glutaredoxin family protein [Pseudalkalibacillus decolorationis]
MLKVQFYTKKNCPLCDKAYLILEELQKEFDFAIEERDIYKKDEWLESYGLMIPVVQVNDEDIEYGLIDKESLRKRLLTFF